MNNHDHDITRRNFLGGAALAAGAAALGGIAAEMATPTPAQAIDWTPESRGTTPNFENAKPIAPVAEPTAWTGEADIVIVGGGGAGLSAAVTAAQAGADVIVLEKNNYCGGDTSIAMLFEGFVPSRWMKSLGLWGPTLDDPEALIAQRVNGLSGQVVYGVGNFMNDVIPEGYEHKEAVQETVANDPDVGLPVAALGPQLGMEVLGLQDGFNNIYCPTPVSGRDVSYMVRIFRQQAETVNWLQDDMGVMFSTKQVAGLPIPGFMHCPIDPEHPEEDWEYWDPHNARGFTEPLYDKACELGVRFYMETPGTALVQKDGRVTGIQARTKDGTEVFFRADEGVLLTTGGFAANQDMLHTYCAPDRAEAVRCWSMNSAEGDGIRMAQGMGARTHMMEDIEIWDGGAVREVGSHAVYSAPNQLARQKSLTVNKKGKRFFNECEYRGYYFSYQAAMTIAQPGHISATLFDSNIISKEDIINKLSAMICEYPCNWFESDFEKYLAEGVIKKADTIEELAEMLEFPPDELRRMVDRYNELCHAGFDEDFFKPAHYLWPIETPPFYAVKQEGGSCFNTWGGMCVDERFAVLDAENDPIEGLYATGENVAGGASVGSCLPGGRLAAWAILGCEPDHSHEE